MAAQDGLSPLASEATPTPMSRDVEVAAKLRDDERKHIATLAAVRAAATRRAADERGAARRQLAPRAA